MLGDNLHTETYLNPFVIITLILLCIAVLIIERKHTVLLLIFIVMFIPNAQRIVLGGIDFTMLRLLIIVAWIRFFLKNEVHCIQFITLDYLLIVWAMSTTIIYSIQQASVSALVNRLGTSFDALGVYFFIRVSIRSIEDAVHLLRNIGILSIILACFFLFEDITKINLFGSLGGVPSVSGIWNGLSRSQGAFSHPILAGVYSAALLPYGIYFTFSNKKDKLPGILFVLSLLLIIFSTKSSTAFIGTLIALSGMLLYRFRSHMRVFRWLVFITIAGLEIVMTHHVWHLINRVSVRGGATGWHRYILIQRAFTSFDEWWLLGTRNIDHWNIWANDITNHYILEGIRGGALTLLLFILLIVFAYKAVGKTMQKIKNDKENAMLIWSLGVSIAVHMFNFIGVSYFDQTIAGWYLSLALISSCFHIENTDELYLQKISTSSMKTG